MNRLLAFIALAFVLIAVFLYIQQIYIWDAALLTVLAVISFIVMLLQGGTPRKTPRDYYTALKTQDWQSWLRLSATGLSLLVALSAKSAPMQGDFTLLFLIWLAALVMFCMSLVVPWVRQRRDAQRTVPRIEVLALGGLVITAGLCRLVGLGSIPGNLGGDEGTQLLLGTRLVARPFGNPFATGWFSVPTFSFVLYGLVMRVFGATMAGGRVLSVFAGTAAVLFTFLLGKSVAGRRFGWVAAICVAFSAYHIHYSRLASNQIFDPLIGTCALWLVHTALKDRNTAPYAWGLAGVVAGLGWYAYFGARWVTFLIALILLWRWFSDRDFLRRHVKGMGVFALGWGIAVFPLLGWYYEHPSALTERYNAVSIFASGWLEREVVITGKSAARLLLQQFWKSATAFHLTPDPTFWYYPGRPLADIITGALMLVGTAACFWRARWPSKAFSLIWFWSTLFMAWVLTENPPSSQRGLLLVPAAAFLAAWGFETLWSLPAVAKRQARPILLILMGLSVLINLVFYFGVYTPKHTYGNPTAEIATKVSQYTLAHPTPVCADAQSARCEGMVYFLGPPRLYWEFGSMAFLLRNFPGADVMPGVIPADVTTPARFILVEQRMSEFGPLAAAYPDGVIVPITDSTGQIVALIYDWQP